MNYHGIIPPMLTPLLTPNSLDVEGLDRLIEHLIGGGIHGLFLLGTTGEGPGLSHSLRREIITRTCQSVAQRVPVLVCITDTVFEQALEVANEAAKAGAEAVVAAPPYYWTASQSELLCYFRALADRSPLPLLLYNMPARTQTVIQPETIQAAMEHPRIIGLKDSSCSLGFLHQVLQARDSSRGGADWPVLVGDEETLPYAIHAGAQGGVTGGANVFPRLLVRYYEASVAQNADLLQQIRPLIIRLGALYRVTSDAFAGIRGIKTALSLMGICGDTPTFPFGCVSASQREQVSLLIEEISGLEKTLPAVGPVLCH